MKFGIAMNARGVGVCHIGIRMVCIWRASFSRNAVDLKQAYKDLNADILKVKKFLASQGIKDAEVVFDELQFLCHLNISVTI